MPALDRRRGRGEDDGHLLQLGAHHGDVAGVVGDAFFLLEARLVRLVDDDQAEPGIGEEERGAGADDDLRLAGGDRPPGAAALRLPEARMPGHGIAAEAGGEALEEGLGQGDFGEEDERLLCLPDSLGDGLEIDFGLARTGDPVEHEGCEFAGRDGRAQLGRGLRLGGFERGGIVIRIGIGEGIVDRHLDRLDRSGLDQAADHAVGDAADDRQLADQPLAFADPLQRLGALRGQALGYMAGRAIFGDRPGAVESARRGERHAKHRGKGGEIIIRGPFDQPAQGCGKRGQVVSVDQWAQAVVADLFGGEPLRLPNRADQLARPERRDDDRAGLDRHAVRHPVIERAQSGVEDDDTGAGHCPRHIAIARRSGKGGRSAQPLLT